MPSPSRPSSARSRLRGALHWVKPVLGSRILWLGLLALVGGLLAFYLAMNHVVMPLYTRHGVEIAVPETRELPFEQAQEVLRRRDLRPERRDRPFNPTLPRDVVVDQNPPANAAVKPGRRVYLYVNSGPHERVTVPDVLTLSESLARARLKDAGIAEVEVREDDVPSPYAGTVTRQEPRPGNTVTAETRVTLWVSPGPGDESVDVPDVRGLTPADARQVLTDARLWVDPAREIGGTVTRQDPRPGSSVTVGTEIRLYSEPLSDEEAFPEPSEEPLEEPVDLQNEGF